MAASLYTRSQMINTKLGALWYTPLKLYCENYKFCSGRRFIFCLSRDLFSCSIFPKRSTEHRFTRVFADGLHPNIMLLNYERIIFRRVHGSSRYFSSISFHAGLNVGQNEDRRKAKVLKSQIRWDSSSARRNLPPLMDFPEIVWPSVIKSLRNRVLSSFIITPYFDREFRLNDFVQGSKQALQCVSNYLSCGDYKSLEGLVTDDALKEVKRNIASFSVEQRHELSVDKDDIYFSFPYQIGIMFNDDDRNQQRFVEITMVYHILRGLKELKAQDVEPPMNLGMVPEYQEKIHLCNYRFIREFTKGIESQWTINVLNHFKPVDRVRAS